MNPEPEPIPGQIATQSFGSDLLAHVLATIQQLLLGRSIPGLASRRGDRLVYYAGHDLNLYVAAANRMAKPAVFSYVTRRWYNCSTADSPSECPQPDSDWAAKLLSKPTANHQSEPLSERGPFHGPHMRLDVRGGPARGPMAMGNYLA